MMVMLLDTYRRSVSAVVFGIGIDVGVALGKFWILGGWIWIWAELFWGGGNLAR
jgi:hypothetical protein